MGKGKPIKDEFSDLDISTAYRYMLRRNAKGLCRTCGKPRVTFTYCLEHAIEARNRSRKVRKSKKKHNCVTRQLEEALKNG